MANTHQPGQDPTEFDAKLARFDQVVSGLEAKFGSLFAKATMFLVVYSLINVSVVYFVVEMSQGTIRDSLRENTTSIRALTTTTTTALTQLATLEERQRGFDRRGREPLRTVQFVTFDTPRTVFGRIDQEAVKQRIADFTSKVRNETSKLFAGSSVRLVVDQVELTPDHMLLSVATIVDPRQDGRLQ